LAGHYTEQQITAEPEIRNSKAEKAAVRSNAKIPLQLANNLTSRSAKESKGCPRKLLNRRLLLATPAGWMAQVYRIQWMSSG
jgi:hypothetical protein